jgi:hypothetical protein
VRHHEQPTRGRLIVALVIATAAVLVKPGIAAFFLLPLFAALAIVRRGVRAALADREFYALPALVLLPTAALYAYSFATNRFLAKQPGVEINPRLLTESFYWRGWLDMIERVLRPTFFGSRAALLVLVVSACAILLTRTKTQRAILLAFWGGYVLLGLVISNQTSSHDYYSLPLIPIVALSLSLVADVLVGLGPVLLSRRSAQVVFAAVLLAVLSVGFDEKARSLSLPRPDASFERRVHVYEQIGELVHHTSRALALEPWGVWYHGWIAGRYWPDQGDLLWERRNDRLPPMSAGERFVTTDERYWPAVGTMRPRPAFFIVADPFQLVLQPDLCVYLSDYRKVAETPDYVIFDLSRPQGSAARVERRQTAVHPAPVRYYYHFPPAWYGIDAGMTKKRVLRVLGSPQHTEVQRNLRKTVEDWFYGPGDEYAIVFIDDRVFIKAENDHFQIR